MIKVVLFAGDVGCASPAGFITFDVPGVSRNHPQQSGELMV